MAKNAVTGEELNPLITDQIDTEVKNSIIDIYEDLMRTVWAKIVPTLGSVTVVTIMQRAIKKTSARHPLLQDLSVSDSGVSFDKIKAQHLEEGKDGLKDGFKELIANLFDILAKLTGNILVKQLMKEVEGVEIP